MGWLCKEVCVLSLGNKSLFMVIHQVVGTVCTELIGLPYHTYHVNQLICIKICPTVHFKSQSLFYDCGRMVDLSSYILKIPPKQRPPGGSDTEQSIPSYQYRSCSTSITKMSFPYLTMNTWLPSLNYIAKNLTLSILPKVNISEKQL